LKEEDEKVQ
jgi:hypothetical protein